MPAAPLSPPSAGRNHRRVVVALAGVIAIALTAAACGSSATTATDGAGPSPATSALSAPGSSAPGTTVGTVTVGTTKAGPSTTTTTSKPGATTSSTASTTTIPGTDPGTLPQTDDKPTASGALWDAGTHDLWDAIVADDPGKAMPFFFPLSAYKQVKGISDPEHDYQTRLIAYFDEDIHALHKQLGDSASQATFVRVDVPNTALWIKPGVEYNKGAYWRVQDNKLLYTVGGVQKSFVVKSMISWRGEWYVVHLTSIR